MSGEPTRARIRGSVTSVSRSRGLRGHFTYTTICGSEISGMASRLAVRMEYRLNRTPAATRAQTIILRRMTALMRVMIIGGCPERPLIGPLQLVFCVDEKTPEGDDLSVFVESVEDLCVQLALDAGVNLLRPVLPGLLHDAH